MSTFDIHGFPRCPKEETFRGFLVTGAGLLTLTFADQAFIIDRARAARERDNSAAAPRAEAAVVVVLPRRPDDPRPAGGQGTESSLASARVRSTVQGSNRPIVVRVTPPRRRFCATRLFTHEGWTTTPKPADPRSQTI